MASTPARGYHEVTIPSTDTRIVLSVYPAAPGAPVVVFVPGTMTHPLFYDEFLTRLSAEGINVVGVHPLSHGKSPRERDVYLDLVRHLIDLRERKGLWLTLPGEINRWWRDRREMKLAPSGDGWRIEGPGSHRARVAYATLEDDRVAYQLDAVGDAAVLRTP